MPRSQGDSPRPLLTRDAGLRRVSRLTGWLAVGGLLLTGAIAKVAAQSFSGHAAKAATPARTAPATPAPSDGTSGSAGSSDDTSGDSLPSDPSAQDPGPQPPTEIPQPSSSSDGAVSGGS